MRLWSHIPQTLSSYGVYCLAVTKMKSQLGKRSFKVPGYDSDSSSSRRPRISITRHRVQPRPHKGYERVAANGMVTSAGQGSGASKEGSYGSLPPNMGALIIRIEFGEL